MGVKEMDRFMEQWQMDAKALRRRLILAPTPRERERVKGGEIVGQCGGIKVYHLA